MHLTREPSTEQEFVRGIEQHRQPLTRRLICLTGGDHHLAEDIVQETLLRAWLNHPPLTERHISIGPWLFTVARNLLVDHHRHAGRVRHVPEVDSTALVGSYDEAVLLAHDMANALSRLTREHRAIIVEFYYRGRQLAEVAELMNLPLGTAKSRLHNARRALRNITADLAGAAA